MTEQFLTTKQVSERLDISEYTCRKWMRSGKLPAYKDWCNEWRMTESELVRFMQVGRNE